MRAIWEEVGRDRRKVVLVVSLVAVQGGVNVLNPLAIREAVDAIFVPDLRLTIVMASAMVALSLAWNALSWWHRSVSARVGYGLLERLQTRVFDHLQKLPVSYFKSRKSGDIRDKVTENFTVSRHVFVRDMTRWLHSAVSAMGSGAVLFVLDSRVFAAAVPAAVIILWLTLRVGRRRATLAKQIREATAEQSTVAGEAITVRCVVVNKTLGGKMHRVRFRDQTRVVTHLTRELDVMQRVLLAPVDLAIVSISATLFVFVAVAATGGGLPLSPGTLVAINAALLTCLYHIHQVMAAQLDLAGALGRFEDTFEILDTAVPIKPGNRTLPPDTPGKLTFSHVRLRYPDDSAWALDDISFEVPPGKHYAIVGDSGAGKSTVSRCAVRLDDPTSGTVAIDGVDLRELTEDCLRATVGLVPQDTALINATVLSNIRWGLDATVAAPPDSAGSVPPHNEGAEASVEEAKASVEQVEQVARQAQIHDWIVNKLPNGYDTVVGSDGAEVSGGQAQRIQIARVLLRNPRVLVLDEATSALDPRLQRAVNKALHKAQQGRTTLTIAHRLSSVRAADQILVLDGGRLVERGTHDELMAKNGHYAKHVVAALGPG